jgi:3-deoxy-D-manno-octulosonic-acid transferase
VSVGETVAARELVDTFRRDNPRWDVRISTTTATGRAVAEKYWGEDGVFYYPLDFSRCVRRAFDKIRPTLLVLMELEIWPNFLAEAYRRGIPVIVANARITERSVKRLRWAPSVTRNMTQTVEAWYAQSGEYAERLERLGVPSVRIEVTGSVKYDAVPDEIDGDEAKYYRSLFGCSDEARADGGDLLFVAGSTHPTEEKTLLDAWRKVYPEPGKLPKIVLAPRHPERLAEVEALAARYGRVARRSTLAEPTAGQPKPNADADIILVDTMGELSKIYNAADIVFVGGTLIRHGGQNFIEPCGLAKPTIVGPHLSNFNEPAKLLGENGCLKIVESTGGLEEALRFLAENPGAGADMGARARALLLEHRGAARRMADRLAAMAKRVASRY